MVGGWLLAWDFPVLYCWSAASLVGVLVGHALYKATGPLGLLMGTAVGLVPLAALFWLGTRPQPGLLVVYRDHPDFDAPQRVLDSVLTVAHPSGVGRDIPWPHQSYSRFVTSDGEPAALFVFRSKEYRDSLRSRLAQQPLVRRMIDTLIPQ
jgi:hypothetical protein